MFKLIEILHISSTIEEENPMNCTLGDGLPDFSITDNNLFLKNDSIPNYISFDGYGIDLLDDTKGFYKSGDYKGFVSSELSDENCELSELYLISIWNDVDELNLNKGLAIKFYGDCVREIYVQFQNENTETIYENIYSVDSDLFILKDDITCKTVRIYILKTTYPNQLVKIAYIKYHILNVFNKIKNMNLLEEINVLSEDLPMNTFDFSITSDSVLDFDENDKFLVYSNDIYYGTFYLDGAERVSKRMYNIRSSNCIKKLEETPYYHWGALQNNIGNCLIEDKTNTMDSVSQLSGVDIVSNEDLYKEKVFGMIPYKTCRYALCALAFAGCYMVDSSRDNKITLKRIPISISSNITTNSKRIIGEAKYCKSQRIQTAILVYPRNFSQEVCEIKCDNAVDTGYDIVFPNPPTYIDETKFSGNHKVEFRSLTYMAFFAETAGVTIKGYNYVLNQATDSVTNLEVTNGTTKKFEEFNLVSYGSKAPSIESKRNDITKYIKSGGTITARIKLAGERVGDLIKIETAYDGMKTGIITSMNIAFGYCDVANIEVLEWNI